MPSATETTIEAKPKIRVIRMENNHGGRAHHSIHPDQEGECCSRFIQEPTLSMIRALAKEVLKAGNPEISVNKCGNGLVMTTVLRAVKVSAYHEFAQKLQNVVF